MEIGIIGAGFAGLSAAYNLAKNGVNVTVFEKEDRPGGLAIGFKEKNWKWSLEKHYHHWFYSDWKVRNLAKEIGHKVYFPRPTTAVYVDGEIRKLDSALSLLKFSKLPFFERLQTGIILFYLKMTPFWKLLESVTSEEFIKKYMGDSSWKVLWQPLFEKKFTKYAKQIPASWFWARIKKRSPRLGYPEGGFESFAWAVDEKIRKLAGKFFYQTQVEEVGREAAKLTVKTNGKRFKFDKVICTLASPIFVKITKDLPKKYINNLSRLKGIGAVNLVLSIKQQFLEGGEYWLSINELDFPFLAVVEHTNYMDKINYGGERILYLGNYLEHSHPYFQAKAEDLVKEFMPFLQKINPSFNKSQINRAYLFKTPFAQPIIPLNYSKILPSLETPIKGLYLANIQQVYPWDRGTNYAVELGEKVAELVVKSGS